MWDGVDGRGGETQREVGRDRQRQTMAKHSDMMPSWCMPKLKHGRHRSHCEKWGDAEGVGGSGGRDAEASGDRQAKTDKGKTLSHDGPHHQSAVVAVPVLVHAEMETLLPLQSL